MTRAPEWKALQRFTTFKTGRSRRGVNVLSVHALLAHGAEQDDVLRRIHDSCTGESKIAHVTAQTERPAIQGSAETDKSAGIEFYETMPECGRDYYDDTLLYCLDDGKALS